MPRPHPNPANTQLPDMSLATARWNRGAWLFRDRTLHGLEILLDEAFRVPGTGIRFGLDGIIGLVPGLGDVLAGLLSLIIPLAAWIRGVPYVTLVRMAVNIGIGVLVARFPSLATSSISPGRPTAATTCCSPATWASPTVTPAATGRFCLCWVRRWRWFSPSPWRWWCG